MPDDTQQSGSMIGDIASGLGKVAQYALPAALGAAMGGLGGAAAGAGMGAQGIQELQQRQQDAELKEQQLAMGWQEFALEKQKVGQALQSQQGWQSYRDAQSPEEQKLLDALPLEDRGPYLGKKVDEMEWDKSMSTLEGSANFKAMYGVDDNIVGQIKALGPTLGKQYRDAYMKSLFDKSIKGHQLMTNADGTTTLVGYRNDGSTVNLASGVSQKTIPTPLNTAQKNTKALSDFNAFKTGSGGPPTGGSLRPKAMAEYRDRAVASMVASGTDPDTAEQVASNNLGVKPRTAAATSKGVTDVSLPSNITTTSAAMKYLTMNKGMSAADAKAWIRAHAAD